MPEEQWRSIMGWPGYEVSDHGRVKRGSHIKSHYFDRKGTVVQDDVGQFIFIPVQYLGRRL